MKFAELAAARRTHKAFGSEPLQRETLLELLDVARLAPTHHLNQPWRFRVLGVFRPAGSPAEAYYPDGSAAAVPAV